MQKVRDAERERQYEEFKDRQGEIITGVVKRAEFGHVVVDLGKAEGVIRRDQQIPREVLKPGDRVRSLILSVRREPRGPQIFLSRAHGDYMKKLFAQEVPEIYDGIIEIMAVARDPGSRAKIGVISRDGSIDPVGACVGMKGSRVQAVVQELQGEKIDIIPWSPDTATFVVNALQPAEVTKVVLDEEEGRIDVVVPDDQLSLAIGRRGQNVRLASALTGKQIDIMTEAGRRNSSRNPNCSRPSWTLMKRWPSCWLPKASPNWRKSPMLIWPKSPASKALTTIWPPNCRTALSRRWSAAKPLPVKNGVAWAWKTMSPPSKV